MLDTFASRELEDSIEIKFHFAGSAFSQRSWFRLWDHVIIVLAGLFVSIYLVTGIHRTECR